jgi:hypothetical protein
MPLPTRTANASQEPPHAPHSRVEALPDGSYADSDFIAALSASERDELKSRALLQGS